MLYDSSTPQASTPRSIQLPPAAAGYTVIEEFEDVDAVLKSKSIAVVSNRFPPRFAHQTLVTLDGEPHVRRRRLELRPFEPKNLGRYERESLGSTINDFLRELSDRAEREGDEWLAFDLVPFGRSMLVRMGATLAGVDNVTTAAASDRLYSLVTRMAQGLNVVWVKGGPEESDRIIKDAIEAQASFNTDFFAASRSRREAIIGRDEEPPNDVLSAMLRNQQDDWDDDLLIREVFLYLSASIDTSTRVLCHAVNETLAWASDNPGPPLRNADAAFINAVTQETLRLHPALPALFREVTADVLLPSGRQVRTGERLALPFATANRDRAVFGEDADQFVPERATRVGALRAHGFAFGGGAHACIGRRLAAGGVTTGDYVTQGTIATLLGRLLAAGIERDPEREPVKNVSTYHDAYDSYPVRLPISSSPT